MDITRALDALRSLKFVFGGLALAEDAAAKAAAPVRLAPAPPAAAPAVVPTTEKVLFEGQHISQWRITLAQGLGRHYGVLVWVEPKGKAEREVRAFGAQGHVATLTRIYEHLAGEVARLTARSSATGKTARQSYAQGLVRGFVDALGGPLPGAPSEEALRLALGRPVPRVRPSRMQPAVRPYQAGLRRGASIRPVAA
jgi:hypothetical protein